MEVVSACLSQCNQLPYMEVKVVVRIQQNPVQPQYLFSYTLAQPFIFGYTLGCMVARTTNAPAVANGPPTVWETLVN